MRMCFKHNYYADGCKEHLVLSMYGYLSTVYIYNNNKKKVESVRACRCHHGMSFLAVKAGRFPAKGSCAGLLHCLNVVSSRAYSIMWWNWHSQYLQPGAGEEHAFFKLEVILQLPLTAVNHRYSSSSKWCCWTGPEAVFLGLWLYGISLAHR